MERQFGKSFQSLEAIFSFVSEFFQAAAVDPELRYPVDFALEELFTNIVKYSPTPDASEIGVCLKRDQHDLIIELQAPCSVPFDITAVADPDVTAPIEEREPGGLGLYLVRQMVDSLSYQHKNGQSTIRVIKHLR